MSCAWIVKAMNMSRGRGITIETDLATVLERIHEREHKLIAQRYVDRPLLIRRRKFDIRQCVPPLRRPPPRVTRMGGVATLHLLPLPCILLCLLLSTTTSPPSSVPPPSPLRWVLLTSVNPLVVWRYSHYYLRFSSQEYHSDLGGGDGDYRFAHLTNQSIQKKCGAYGDAIEGNMWSREQFHASLAEEHGAEAGARVAAAVEERMNAVVVNTMRAVCDVIEPRAASFELYGFDLMLDEQYGVWLLEANSSPDMSRNAAPLRAIVDQGLDDLLSVVIELQHKRTPVSKLAAEREACELPCWRLAHKGKALDERDLLRRRFRKKCGADSLAVALAATAPAEGGSTSSGAASAMWTSSAKGAPELKAAGVWK